MCPTQQKKIESKTKLDQDQSDGLREALSLQSSDESKSYHDAILEVPSLVTIESPEWRFFHAERKDHSAAATRLVKYWQRRRELFGQKALLPMTATGEGALSASDLEVFRSGAIVQLPNDEKGRTVLCFDKTRLDDDFDDIPPPESAPDII